MTVRRKAREFALQSLYALELGQGDLSDVKEAVIAGLGAGQEDIIDKILMRCSIAEMLYMKNIPVKVSITEAIQIAGKYSTEESAVFINGILDAFARELSIA
jgi:N utilization substance protein B